MAHIRASTIQKYVGRRFRMLEIIAFDRVEGRTQYFFRCRCDCGVEKSIRIAELTSRSSKTHSCGCHGKQRRLEANLGNTYRRRPSGEAALTHLVARYRTDAAKRGLVFGLSEGEFLEVVSQPCFYCDAAPSRIIGGRYNGAITCSGIDRVDNDVGYTLENCVPCCTKCNSIKNAISKTMVQRLYLRLFPRAA